MTNGPQVPAGWYPDGHGEMRYWDGDVWTGFTSTNYPPAPGANPPNPLGNPNPPGNGVRPPIARATTRWTRRWQFWVVATCVVLLGIGAIGSATSSDPADDSKAKSADKPEPAPAPSDAAPQATPTVVPVQATRSTPKPVVLLFVTDQKDGDSWVASNGNEYRLGLINAPETNEPCGAEATAFTRNFLKRGFTVNAYTTDAYGRTVAEVRAKNGRSLNVELARSGLGDDRYLERFRHENPDLGRRLDTALATASEPACKKAAAPAPLAAAPSKQPAPSSDCMSGYSPCLPIVADLDCGDIGHPVTVTGSDPYRLDRDGDGTGCD